LARAETLARSGSRRQAFLFFLLSAAGFAGSLRGMAATFRKLSVLIPVFNEQATLAEILRRVRAADTTGLEKEIILVDDCSSDGTVQVIRELAKDGDLKTFAHLQNRGKGAAIRTALEGRPATSC